MPEKINVCMVSTFHHDGGAAVAANRLIEALREHIDVSYITKGSRKGTIDPLSFSYEDDTFWGKAKSLLFLSWEKFIFLMYEKNAAVRFLFSTATIGFDVTKTTQFKKANIIHLHWTNQGLLSIHGLKKIIRSGKPIVITMHDFWYFTGGCHYPGACKGYEQSCGTCPMLKHPTTNDLSYRLHSEKQNLFRLAQKLTIVGCSNWLTNEAAKSSVFKNNTTTAIPNPLPIDFFVPQDQKTVRIKYKIPVHKKIILFGSMSVNDPRKGFQYFKKALAQLVHSYSKEELEIVVFGSVKKSSTDEFEHLPFNVHYLGKIDIKNISEMYSIADVYVSPSLEDNLPNTVAEAMSCGIPVAAFHTGGLPEMIDHRKNGYLAEYKNDIDLAEGIEFILNHEHPSTLTSAARQKAISTYMPEKVAECYISVYKSLL